MNQVPSHRNACSESSSESCFLSESFYWWLSGCESSRSVAAGSKYVPRNRLDSFRPESTVQYCTVSTVVFTYSTEICQRGLGCGEEGGEVLAVEAAAHIVSLPPAQPQPITLHPPSLLPLLRCTGLRTHTTHTHDGSGLARTGMLVPSRHWFHTARMRSPSFSFSSRWVGLLSVTHTHTHAHTYTHTRTHTHHGLPLPTLHV
jgi:hypothetical protein